MVARELTKIHETLVKGPIIDVLPALAQPRGEYTVVVSGAAESETIAGELPVGVALLREFGHITEFVASSRREAVAQLASKYGRSQREVYDAIELAKKSAG
jgi:16S rRNA C1402 (ribose-2'-O) methylase RsmI